MKKTTQQRAEVYEHRDQAILRPEVGTQAQFKKRRPPRKYRYDSALAPALDWDGQNPGREVGEWLLAQIEEAARLPAPHKFPEARRYGDVAVQGLADAAEQLKKLGRPFLDWAGKAERLSFEVPTLPLFVHERLSTKAILQTLKAHERDRQMELQLFGDPQISLAQQLEAYEHTGGWVNRMILGDSLVVMNSLLEYEGLGGQVQMIYVDPPYGVKFGSNFQPFVRKRDVRDGSDDDLTREPEMVKAYRDTWELGLHSYLTYLRDRLLLARELLTPTGSVFVQISDENVHHVRELMDEVFGPENYCVQVQFAKTTGLTSELLPSVSDTLLWYSRDAPRVKFRRLYREQDLESAVRGEFKHVLMPDGTSRRITAAEEQAPRTIPAGARLFRTQTAVSPGVRANTTGAFMFDGKPYHSGPDRNWKTGLDGMVRLAEMGRLELQASPTRMYRQLLSDFPHIPYTNYWADVRSEQNRIYAVQTQDRVIERCMLMTTDPGDLVVDPTCGSGTTAYVAEQWGRRWITIDTSRVPLALARQRLVTGTFPFYELRDSARGPSGGFVYKRRKNSKGEDVGGIVPHKTLRSIANNEREVEEVLVDRPEIHTKITRVTGPFCVEATIPTPLEVDGTSDGTGAEDAGFADRLLEVLRRNPVLQLAGNRSITLANIRPPAKSLTISAEAGLEGNGESPGATVALVFGPENGAVGERLVWEAAKEANLRSYAQLIVIGFAIESGAREMVEKCADLAGIPAHYIQATPDLMMGDLLKTMRSSQIFSVTGLPDVGVKRLPPEEKGDPPRYQVELRGLDSFDPVSMKAEHRAGSDVPAWFLDTDYSEMCFHVSQAFFPRTSAWENLKKALKGDFEDSVWEHLAGTTSAPFVAGERRTVAVKVIDDRGNELLVVKSLDEAR